MKTFSLTEKTIIDYKRNLQFFFIALLIISVLNFVLVTPLGVTGIAVIFLLSFSLLFIINFNIIFYTFLLIIFIPYLYPVHQSVLFSFIVFFSMIINFYGNLKEKFKNPLTKPLLFYFLAILPSLVNTPKLLLSLRDLMNLGALFVIFFSTVIGIKDKSSMLKVFYFFIALVFLHSLHVDFLGITTGKRVFGVLYVYYIDFAGLGAVVSLILFIYKTGVKKVFFGISFIIITVGLILTQTRNAWLSCGFAVITLLLFLIFKADKLHIKKQTALVFLIISILTVGMAYIAIGSANTQVEDRLNIEAQTTTIDPNDPTNIGGNSFVSRAFIWHTAVMSFLERPLIGIGAYSFRFVSNLYYTIPKAFYQIYVYQKTPHITYLQVLTETGILGFVFFMIFIISLVRYIIKMLKLNMNKEESLLSLLIAWSFVYIIFSMLMTESWLYGQYVVWIGVLLGLLVSNSKLLSSKQSI